MLDANTSNALVSSIDDAARWLTQPFHGIFTTEGGMVRLAVNRGLGAAVYAIAGSLLAKLIARAKVRGRMRRSRSRRAAA